MKNPLLTVALANVNQMLVDLQDSIDTEQDHELRWEYKVAHSRLFAVSIELNDIARELEQ